uniref:Uncharacterized protein n=1 Tax=Romanomermis culicivorax TaxID=13658 RepID=A0A915K0Q5_ROMCU
QNVVCNINYSFCPNRRIIKINIQQEPCLRQFERQLGTRHRESWWQRGQYWNKKTDVLFRCIRAIERCVIKIDIRREPCLRGIQRRLGTSHRESWRR